MAKNPFTIRSLKIFTTRDSCSAAGTAFLYMFGGNHHLVIAWHNVSGRDFISKQPVSPNGWLPNRLQISLPVARGESMYDVEFQSNLYSDSDEYTPIWRVHRDFGSKLDIAVISLQDLLDNVSVVTEKDRHVKAFFEDSNISLFSHSSPNFESEIVVTSDVFIVGYPEGIAAGNGTAIWKRGTVASEPELPIKDRPCFLIDSATRRGLSGSPVVARYERPSFRDDKGYINVVMGYLQGFCGLYTARVGREADSAQLGIVWPRAAIEEVIVNGVIGRPASDLRGLEGEGKDDPIV